MKGDVGGRGRLLEVVGGVFRVREKEYIRVEKKGGMNEVDDGKYLAERNEPRNAV